MTKTIDTLVPDMLDVLKGLGGWDAAVTHYLSEGIAGLAQERFSKPQGVRSHLSPSMLGSPDRQLWYKINCADEADEHSAELLGTFFYGDILEVLCIALAKAAGHKVTGLQEKLDICGITGSGDCVIDGVVVDVKSTSPYNFDKFKYHRLKGYTKKTRDKDAEWIPPSKVDSYGYISQLSSYLYGYKDNPSVTNKTSAAFLAVRKDFFTLALDMYDLSDEVKNKPQEVAYKRGVSEGELPEKCYEPVPEGKSGNMKIDSRCNFCGFKKKCYPKLRTFIYSSGPVYLTTTKKRPQPHIKEVTTPTG